MTKRKWRTLGISSTSSTTQKNRKNVQAKRPKTENIIFVGSEMHYDSFWWKMMFVAGAYKASSGLRKADKCTIAYIDTGYTRMEKLALEQLAASASFDVKRIAAISDVVSCMNNDRENYKIQDLYFFSHGIVGKITLNYDTAFAINFDQTTLAKINKKSFTADGFIYSYACRTGISVEDFKLGFNSDAEAKPELSLAQKMADYFGITVKAFLTRTEYGEILREKSLSENIASVLKDGRKFSDGQIIDLPPEHQALPHDGLANSGSSIFRTGPKGEGTDNYALWRKRGGRLLPIAAETPKGLSKTMRLFKPKP